MLDQNGKNTQIISLRVLKGSKDIMFSWTAHFFEFWIKYFLSSG